MQRKRIILSGIVQGVGFRPFVWRLASGMGLTGFVCNRGAELLCEVQGDPAALETFGARMIAEAPVNSRIENVTRYDLPPKDEASFCIIKSRRGEEGTGTGLSPDLALCRDCRREMSDPSDRRYRHPFISCTACGPRFSIALSIPYDRTNTSMKDFEMCPRCASEYESPSDRRYHAQPVACHDCGPVVRLAGTELTGYEAIEQTRSIILQGGIAVVKGIGGFHFFCDAGDPAAVERLRQVKGRRDKPFAVMAHPDDIRRFALVSAEEAELLESAAAPIVLLKKSPDYPLAGSVSPDNDRIGAMVPYTPLHHMLLRPGDVFVATSGNLSGEPVCCSDREAEERLLPVADALLTHDRPIVRPADDSVVRRGEGDMLMLRRSRGYAPGSVEHFVRGKKPADILAMGSDLKNTLCLKAGSKYILSQHIGDLEHKAVFDLFCRTAEDMKALFSRRPSLVCCDMHPDYLSSRYAAEISPEPLRVQHHAAHAAAVVAEHGLTGPVIGVVFDGTGYGSDGAIWGGEFLAGTPDRFERPWHFEYIPLQGGDAAIREPVRSYVSYMHYCGEDTPGFPLLREALDRGVNTCRSSSCGRLFDAAAWVCGIRSEPDYEARNSILLENMSEPTEEYLEVEMSEGVLRVADLIPRLEKAIGDGMDPHRAASVFHRTIARLVLAACCDIRRQTGYDRVCLSGGVFQNALLLGQCLSLLRDGGFEVYTGNRVPVNDGGLSLGQALIGQMRGE
ncbi:MAG: carbamoyltransferase HypF [Abditibacteriota bacterium]|nr:carbamoyltransferase HypF [Abditibacteriota bacterium]